MRKTVHSAFFLQKYSISDQNINWLNGLIETKNHDMTKIPCGLA